MYCKLDSYGACRKSLGVFDHGHNHKRQPRFEVLDWFEDPWVWQLERDWDELVLLKDVEDEREVKLASKNFNFE